MAVTLTIKMGSSLAQARLAAFDRAKRVTLWRETSANVIQFTYVDSLLTYS